MKKLIFGLLATVLFSGVSVANIVNTQGSLAKEVSLTNSKAEKVNSIIWCHNFTIEVSIGVLSIGTNVTVCCGPQVIPGQLNCWTINSKANPNINGSAGYIAIKDLDPKIKNEIINKNLTEISTTSSSQGKIDNVMYSVKKGVHKIIKVDGVSYLELILEKV